MKTPEVDRESLDLEIRIGLLGSEADKQDAIRLLLDTYGKFVMSFLANRFSMLDPADRATALNEALLAVYHGAEQIGNDDRPLAPFLFEVSRRRAISIWRRNSVRRQNDEAVVSGFLTATLGTQTSVSWGRLRGAEKVEQVQEAFRVYVGSLKGQQKRVAAVMADNLPDVLSDSEIAAEASLRGGEPITTVAVKGAKAALVKKFRELMATKLEQL